LLEGKGSGLGLCLCKGLVQLHEGTIKCDSANGKGSTFSFTIPFNVEPLENM
jgi:signal transduction histidine kinase